MSEIPLLEDENAGSEQHNITTGDEQRRVSLTMEELHSMFEQVIEQKFVPLIYTIVKQEIGLAQDKILTSFKQNSGSGIHSSESRSFQLQFLTKISRPVFSNNIIKGERSTPITIALFDAITKEVVKFGPEASAKVEIVPVKDDFDCDKRSNWTLEEFNKYVAREKPGRKSLLTGNVYLNLKEGVGLVGDMSFTHNKNYLNKCNLRLGAKVVDNLDGTRIREAVTESFVVKDHRYTYNKKHRPPHLHDDVWRLDKILKGGAFHTRLSREKVNTVKDFLSLLYLDPTRLRNIVGRGMSPTMWGVTVAHAQTCVLDPTLKFYHPSGSQQETSVVFNVVGQVMGLLSECQYAPVDKLSETEKAEAHNLVIAAFKHWEDVLSFDDEASLMNASSHLFHNVMYSNPAMAETSGGRNILTSQNFGEFNYPQEIVSSQDIMPSIYSMAGVNSLDDVGLHNIENMDLRYDQPLNPGQVTNSLVCETESNTQAFCEDEHLQYFDPDCPLLSRNSSLESQALVGFLLARSATVCQRRWSMLFSVLKWFTIRRIVARKTLNRETQRYC